ncbi:hypothetical protein [Lutimonas zeaxanthinifaciens]|uniref:hypothetical protein n=1 Tax=Lutimonas zeaxanthinifaciens TaxID=3060215 RepID=UPI00265CDF40|nr:hypothetical protein [Lutimonas sp. YSD2104]WKK66659.1 hypothetical protein QZH61_03345 [Lutimonas sp. YSD2104]
MKSFKLCILALALLFFTSADLFAQEKRPSREKWDQVSMQGTVTEINAETREITLMGSDGGLVTMTAGEDVERFDEIAVDDVIKFEYYTYIKAEFREPTAEEVAEPVQIVAEAGKAPEGVDPAAAVGAVVKAVVTIEALNRPFMVATVSGPNGNYVSIPMEDEELMKELHIGEVLILTYAEAMAIGLEKVELAK